MSLHIAASDILQEQNWCCIFKKVQYRPKTLHIAASDISHGYTVGAVHSKRCNIALCLCILLHPIYHKEKTGVVYSKRWTIACVFAYCCIWYITRTKLVLCIQKGAISPMYLHIPASDVSQGQNWCCVFKKVEYRLCLCILLRLIYYKDKTSVVYSKRWNIAFVFAYCCVWYTSITRTKLVLCIQNDTVMPLSLHITAFDIHVSQGQNWCYVLKKVQYRPKSLHIASSDISQGQNWCCVFKKVQYRLSLCNIAQVVAYCCIW